MTPTSALLAGMHIGGFSLLCMGRETRCRRGFVCCGLPWEHSGQATRCWETRRVVTQLDAGPASWVFFSPLSVPFSHLGVGGRPRGPDTLAYICLGCFSPDSVLRFVFLFSFLKLEWVVPPEVFQMLRKIGPNAPQTRVVTWRRGSLCRHLMLWSGSQRPQHLCPHLPHGHQSSWLPGLKGV